MDRRKFMSGAAATLVSSPAAAEIACQVPIGTQRTCDVGVRIGSMQTPWQNCQYWCWAAAAQTAFGLAGYRVEQEHFALKLFGNPYVCQPANGRMIKKAVDGPWLDNSGKSFAARFNYVINAEVGISHPAPLNVVWQELLAGRPLLSGSIGHATLITAMNYTERAGYAPYINSITLRDPWPQSPNKREMTPQEFNGVNLLGTFSFQRI